MIYCANLSSPLNPGRLKELLIPNKQMWLRPVFNNPQRRTRWSAALVENPTGSKLVSIDSTLPNRLIAKALAEKALPYLAAWQLEKAEYTMGKSRFDFLLSQENHQMALEVKSVTLVQQGTALFPDAITARGARHLNELTEIANRKNWAAAVLFVVQRSDAHRVLAAPEIDPVFATALAKARENGVQIWGVKCKITPRAVSLAGMIPAE